MDYTRTETRRFVYRSGGQATPGPWWELAVPFVGSFVVSKDNTLFGPKE